ncbi:MULTISPECIES: DUF2555 domain-containing protein [unclassified Prochlorococcus]|uniref:DUF2555 domain-containing protein n=1 Tax=unclassified Prochlorococcus TaxID=2627481 RepID=UPI0005337854|nr:MULTISPECIES: DUF2555 domain-containing protein [unclassified Prochlorococcus]KGG16702.1 hypothetical protein EV06_0544 [Prochlorococcus sp. MIT 0602]KGG18326.1 hypothetical protein EV07_0242 [Prochlorococcus sp. MIT 0603]
MTNQNKENGCSDSDVKITEELLFTFDDKSTAQLAERLEEEDYLSPFESLNDWHLLRALAIHRPELTLDYHHLIDQEPFDED